MLAVWTLLSQKEENLVSQCRKDSLDFRASEFPPDSWGPHKQASLRCSSGGRCVHVCVCWSYSRGEEATPLPLDGGGPCTSPFG